jgi:hypothetical protein
MTKQEIREQHRQKNASSISRIYSQFQSGGQFGIVTAFGEGSFAENLPYFINLGKDVNSLGYGFVPIDGYWIDDTDETVWDESSLWIPSISKAEIDALSAKYSQRSYIWGRDAQWGEYATGSDVSQKHGTKFSVRVNESLDKAWSKYKGHPFKLVGSVEDNHLRIVGERKLNLDAERYIRNKSLTLRGK